FVNGCQSSGRANTKLQQRRRIMRLNLQRLLPSFVIIATAREHDNKRARGLCAGVNCSETALLTGVRGLRAFEGFGRAGRGLEVVVHWLYKHDASLKLPYQDNLSALIHEPTFRNAVGPAVFAKVKVIKDLGNLAVHSHKPLRQFDAIMATRELFQLGYW